MAADTAVTASYRVPNQDTNALRVYFGAQKLRPIPKIQGGVSVWGLGNLGSYDTDIWLNDFISRRQNDYENLNDFARILSEEVRMLAPPLDRKNPQSNSGFHVAGFVDHEGKRLPAFYHVHNGENQYFKDIDPAIMNANFDRPPHEYGPNEAYLTRNGDTGLYTVLFNVLDQQLFNALRLQGFTLPFPPTLERFAEYLRFQIKLVSDVYKLSNVFPGIGGDVTTLAISSGGYTTYETR